MKKFYLILSAVFLLCVFACGGGSSHSSGYGSGVVNYDEIEIYPSDASGDHSDYPDRAIDGNEETYCNVYDPIFSGDLAVEFAGEDNGAIKEQEFWALLHGNGGDVTIKEIGGTVLGTVNPPVKGWYCFRSDSTDWALGIRFVCDGGEQLMVYDVYKIITYEVW